MANINIGIPEEVHKNLKIAAVMQQRALKDLIITTLEQYLSDSSSKKKISSQSKKTLLVRNPSRVRKKKGVRK